jgi:hypothetical protein
MSKRRIAGISMIVMFLIVVFSIKAMQYGFTRTLIVFAISIAVAIWVMIAAYLIAPKEK